ncbi:multiple inositol polyphosphate phosphatase 1-like isoform X2 [Penaeus chinensis]|nr:multiple inositol polyphosphate phosphatase 1-like isoform X2 [Penaeus chinensis]XP_047495942.1 multiple inositol polyphosphate phosphatase 1-like isoform X2 [Penaeus chinensis]
MLPTLKRMILKSHSYGNGELCPRDLALLRAWRTSKLDAGDTRHLTPEGRKEIEGIALRFKAAFPELVYKPYHVGKAQEENERGKPGEGTKFAFAPSFPTYDSAVTYLETLYGRHWGHVGLDLNGSPALQYFYFCRNYITKVVICSKKKKPFHNFISGKFMEEVISRVSKRLGIAVTIAKLRAMYNACRYQKAWRPERPSAWCAAFTPRDLEVLEYWEDLRMYHDQGPAHSITYKQACLLGADLLLHFRRRVNDNITDIDSTTYFVSMEALVPFLSLLGLFKDSEPLTEENINPDRVWKTSKFSSYGSNLAFVLSLCEDNSWWVSALLNEVKIQLPGCDTVFGCPWGRFVEEFDYLENCDFHVLCGGISYQLRRTQTWQLLYIMNNWM